jgi:hypothetical protein
MVCSQSRLSLNKYNNNNTLIVRAPILRLLTVFRSLNMRLNDIEVRGFFGWLVKSTALETRKRSVKVPLESWAILFPRKRSKGCALQHTHVAHTGAPA